MSSSENYIISGIQQLGVGNTNVHETFKWYRQNFGTDIKIFEEAAEANLMLPYTGGKPHKRHAILAISMNGGGGFEIWQYTSRKAEHPTFELQLGDLGIYIGKIKCRDINESYHFLKSRNTEILSEIVIDPSGNKHFYLKDLWGNLFELVEEKQSWFGNTPFSTGGIFGATIGVSDIDRSLKLYSDILGFDRVIYDSTGVFEDLSSLRGGDKKVRRVLLRNSIPRRGSFADLLGDGSIELIQAYDYKPRKIFENRFWGDCGFIHLCFDIKNMQALKSACEKRGFPFTVDGGAGFEMGEAAGHFTYIEDPDGALIEFVETKKLPVIKKMGWYLNVSKGKPEKSLPRFVIKALSFNRVKDK